MRRLRIVHTESSLGWGGQEIRILSESKGLIARGHDVRVVGAPQSRISAEAPAWGVPAVVLPIGRKGWRGLRSLAWWLKRNPCDIVVTHSSTDSWLSAVALSVLLAGRTPIVRVRHVSVPVSKGPLTRWLYTRAASRIVTTGEALKRELIDGNGFPAGRVESVPTGIDPIRFAPGDRAGARARLGLPRDTPLVGIVATLRSWKGHKFLIEAVTELPAEVGLVIVGEGPMRDQLEALVVERGLRERTVFAGNQADVAPWLQALDVFALPSYAHEGVPQALIQAMMTGLACVTTAVGSIGELAIHEKTALVVPAQDAGALSRSLALVLEDEKLRKALGDAARAHAIANYSYERMLDRMELIYGEAACR
jgi:glycosyltransferase involved in cell wall biosynthesis